MQVLKFGGSSIATPHNIRKVVTIIQQACLRDKTIVVLSAFGGATDLLLECGALAAQNDETYRNKLGALEHRHMEAALELIPIDRQSGILSQIKRLCNEIEDICKGVFLLGELSPRTKDKVVSYGELISSLLISAVLHEEELPNTWVDSRELIYTDSHFTFAAVNFDKTNEQVKRYFSSAEGNLFIVPGFIASDAEGVVTTLGRGGSDYTAAVLAAALGAASLEIWTDVSGMMTADPRMVSHARQIPHISYKEAMELSHFGAKVIYPPTIQPVMNHHIPVWIKNTFEPDHHGTLIEAEVRKNGSVRGISSVKGISLLSLEGSGMVGVPGFSKRLFEALAGHSVNVILITQGSSEHSICVGINEADESKASLAVKDAFSYEINTGKLQPPITEQNLAIVALVGDNMKSHPGISGRMFGAMGRNGINVRAIAQGSSERNISAVIKTADVKKALNVLHEEFFETSYKVINLFLAGVGNVGSRLITQLQEQQAYLGQHLRLQIRVVGMANSTRMLFNDKGIPLGKWKALLAEGDEMDLNRFIEIIREKNMRNAVFADITANREIAMRYDELLRKSISVVACNKIACSSSYKYYRELKDLAREFNSSFLFETNVGAGLPVIGTLNDLLRSGDKINKIEAVLSGTLNFVFNHYAGEKTFAEVVRQAQEEGYTEPDPRLDLGGTDVMRKIMILARETGALLEMEDIANHSFMPPSCMEGDVVHFYEEMVRCEDHFRKLYEDANKQGKKLKFVASYSDGKASVGLRHIDAQHDFYHLYGKDNVVLFYTDRYSEQPLVIKGAGAGADVTASGVFADVVRTI